ncbi:MAG: DUF4381 domain-containing protein [Burkholderiaceae bacterium]
MNIATQPALQLRDIHLPAAPAFWPPAPGWWVVAALLVLLIGGAAFFGWRRHRVRARERRGMRTLVALEAGFRADRTPERLASISALLRQIALARFPRRQVASLTGSAWLRFLDASGGDGRFVDGPGRVLLGVPYQRALPTDLDVDALMTLIRAWVRINLGRTA